MVLIYRIGNEVISFNSNSFRPLTGIMVLIVLSVDDGIQEGLSLFPSPYGDYGSYRQGIMNHLAETYARKFPSPYGDYGSYQQPKSDYYHGESVCFRPLTGIMVLIRTLYRWLYEAFEMAFCGADHIFSSFFVFYKKMIFKKSFGPEF